MRPRCHLPRHSSCRSIPCPAECRSGQMRHGCGALGSALNASACTSSFVPQREDLAGTHVHDRDGRRRWAAKSSIHGVTVLSCGVEASIGIGCAEGDRALPLDANLALHAPPTLISTGGDSCRSGSRPGPRRPQREIILIGIAWGHPPGMGSSQVILRHPKRAHSEPP